MAAPSVSSEPSGERVTSSRSSPSSNAKPAIPSRSAPARSHVSLSPRKAIDNRVAQTGMVKAMMAAREVSVLS